MDSFQCQELDMHHYAEYTSVDFFCQVFLRTIFLLFWNRLPDCCLACSWEVIKNRIWILYSFFPRNYYSIHPLKLFSVQLSLQPTLPKHFLFARTVPSHYYFAFSDDLEVYWSWAQELIQTAPQRQFFPTVERINFSYPFNTLLIHRMTFPHLMRV